MKKLINLLLGHKFSIILIILLCFSAFTYAFNLFNYPYYENDEGTYLAQAWSIINLGKLAPYTYWYDHSPVGWILIAIWELVSGGFHTFGFSVNSGRVLMLILHVLTAYLTYSITNKVTGSKVAGFISVLIFSLSPLGLTFQRRVLLDNIMIFWFLVSYNLILGTGRKLHHYIFSAIFYAIAVLSKESAIFFLPVMLFVIHRTSNKSHRIFAMWKWLAISGSIISLYFLYALLKGEFFPYSSVLGNSNPHVSLIETFQFQLSRKGGFFLDPDSGFMLNFSEWIKGGFFIPLPDPMIIIGGLIATLIISIWSIFDRKLLIISLPTLAYWYFLIRGGEVIGFYIIPLIPLLAMCIGSSIFKIINILPNKKYAIIPKVIISLFLLFPFAWYYANHLDVYKINQTKPQIEAIDWISKNLPKDSVLIIDNYAYVDFYEHRNNKYNLPKTAHYYWKADKDPDVKDKILHNKWENIDYILSTPQVKYDAENSGLPLTKNAMDNSTVIKSFNGNKWNIEVRKVTDENIPDLEQSWSTYSDSFITKEGQVIDPLTQFTTSEGQAYALLRAVWSDDKENFDKVLEWSLENLQSKNTSLFAWKFGKNELNKEEILDEGTATDADQDIAFALLLASKKWDENEYQILAKKIILDIWKYETLTVNGKRYIVAGNWVQDQKNKEFTINPSYLSPYAYRIFAKVDNKNNWLEIVDSSYEILNKCSSAKLNVTKAQFLPPDWCNITQNNNIIESENMGKTTSDYSYDSLRTPWRVGLDYLWNKDPRAIEYLKKITLFEREWNQNKKIYSSYTHSGIAKNKTESLAQYGSQLAYFSLINKNTAKEIYEDKILSKWISNNNKNYWGDPKNYYDQNIVWFGVAFYKNKLPNLWSVK